MTWHPTACILCECNCGIEVRLGGDDGRRFERIRGDKAHPASRGYTCEKALRLDHYQNGRHRPTTSAAAPPDGTLRADRLGHGHREVAAGLAGARDTHGGATIFYYGGGGQGNHLSGGYAPATRAFGGRYRSNALAQEKTGEFWVNGQMLGGIVARRHRARRGGVFVGKNPWQSHSFPHARTTLKEIARDPSRSLIVIDPRRTETAELADTTCQVTPGTDAVPGRPRRGDRAGGPARPPPGWPSTRWGSIRSGRCSPRWTSRPTPRSAASTRTSSAARPAASRRRRASPSSRTSACR